MFEELGNDRIDGIQNLSIRVNFNNLIYYFKAKSDAKKFIGFKGPLGLYKNIKDHLQHQKMQEKIRKNLHQI